VDYSINGFGLSNKGYGTITTNGTYTTRQRQGKDKAKTGQRQGKGKGDGKGDT
jgi:hypothetical protein